MRQADCENLVGADRGSWRSSIHNIVQTAGVLVSEQAIETPTRDRRHFAILLLAGIVSELAGQVFHDAKRVAKGSFQVALPTETTHGESVRSMVARPCVSHRS